MYNSNTIPTAIFVSVVVLLNVNGTLESKKEKLRTREDDLWRERSYVRASLPYNKYTVVYRSNHKHREFMNERTGLRNTPHTPRVS